MAALELVIDFDLIARHHFVGFIGHADDRHEFLEHGIRHAFLLCGGGVGRDAIVTLIGDADGDVDQLFRQRVKRSGGHDLLDIVPGALERGGIVGDGLPEIIDPVGFASGHDVVVDGADFRGGIFVFDEAEGRHGSSEYEEV